MGYAQRAKNRGAKAAQRPWYEKEEPMFADAIA